MTTSSNTLLLSLILALCSNAVLLLLVLLQMQSGGKSGSNSIGQGCDISSSLNGHDSGFSADLPRGSIEGAKVKSDAAKNKGHKTHSHQTEQRYLDSSSETEYERSETSQKSRSNRNKNKELSSESLPHRLTSRHKKTEGMSSAKIESLPLLNTGEMFRENNVEFPLDLENSNNFHYSETKNPLDIPTLLQKILTDSSKSGTDHPAEQILHTTSDSSLYRNSMSVSNADFASVRNIQTGNVYTYSTRRTNNINSNENSVNANLPIHRRKRKAVEKTEEYRSDGAATSLLMMEEIFAALKKRARKKFTDPVAKILLPSLINFETMVIRHIDRLNTVMISQDFRLENLELTSLDRQRAAAQEPQSDAQDNKTGDQTINDIIGENLIPFGNSSLQLEGDEGSGDVDVQPTARTTLIPFDNERYLEIYHGLQTLKSKVNALENYNLMSDSELHKTRQEVIKMDDKVTEMNRRQKNLQTRTSMQMYRVTELETFMANTEIAIHTTLDDFSRMSQRLDAFKDRLKNQDNELYTMLAQYGRHDQLMDELRSADSYKAHDLNELRNSLMDLEGRINGLYRVLDQNIDTLRNDVRTMVDNLCTANHLTC